MNAPKTPLALRLARRIVPAATLGAFLALAPAAWCVWALAAASPHLSICSSVALRAVGLLAACSVPAIALAILRRRFFCRFICPVGLLTELCATIRPGRGPKIGKLPRLGQWLALASLGAAILGCPLFLWLDPLAIFAGALGAAVRPVTLISLLPAAMLAAVLLLSLLVPHLWCGRLCPLGGTQDVLADLGGMVRRMFKRDPYPKSTLAASLARRTVLCSGAGGVWALAIPTLFRSGATPLRPPAAASDEMTFKSLCVRCGACVRVCPSGIIKRDLTGEASSFLSPVVRYADDYYPKDYCHEDCNACGQVCPTGAIERLDVAEKNRRPIGLARVDYKRCYLSIPEDCEVCVPECPPRAIEARFEYDRGSVLEIDPALCNGCGKCRRVCPANCLTIEPV